ncbi:hypothetical protein AMECASPLE_037568 [Ameca splendens]|uniref:BED-type domain-containing protein n=1 Tax=Ameca splendens TaxID=208324 RepID=A0ABV1A3Q6_9TELE
MEEHVRVVGPMNEKFTFQKHPDGTIDKGRVICLLCKKEFAYHRSSSSLAYHINAKHPVASAATTVNVSSEDISNLASHSKVFAKLNSRAELNLWQWQEELAVPVAG